LPRVTEKVAELEYDQPPDQLVEKRQALYVDLSEEVVPRLAEAGVLRDDPDQETVAFGRTVREYEATLERLLATELPVSAQGSSMSEQDNPTEGCDYGVSGNICSSSAETVRSSTGTMFSVSSWL